MPERDERFEALLDTLAGLAAANMVLIETLHERGIVDKSHFAHAFARALDTLDPDLRGGMVENTLRSLRDRCMNLQAGRDSEAQAWMRQVMKD